MKDTETKNDTPLLHIIVLQNTVELYANRAASASASTHDVITLNAPRATIHAVGCAAEYSTRTAMCVKACSDIMQ